MALLLVVAASALGVAGGASAQAGTGGEAVGKIAVSASGTVSFNGMPVTLEALRARLAELKQRNGVVWYYREAARGEPPKEAMEVVKLVVDNRLPISMSTKSDYSDVVMPDGSTRPRAPGGSRK